MDFGEFEEDGMPVIGSLVGELTTMCSLPEARLRMETRQVDKFEMTQTSTPSSIEIDVSKALKKYQRSSADKKYSPEDVRTVDACFHSTEYLLSIVLDFDVNPKPGFAEACYTANFFDIYSFLRDRLRAIRVDLHLQNLVTDPVFISTHERCLRFELLALYLLWGRDFGGGDKKFDLHMSLTALSQTIDPLTNAYAKRRSVGQPLPAVDLDREAEITSYVLLLALTSRGGAKTFKGHFLKQPVEIRSHQKVKAAYETGLDYYSNNWTSFLKKYEESDFLSACALLPVVNLARTRVLWRTVRTNRPFFVRKDPTAGPMPPPRPEVIPTWQLMHSLASATEKECMDFLSFNGLDVSASVGNCCIPPRQLTRNPITWWMNSGEWRSRANDGREFLDFAWKPNLEESFHAKIGKDVGDDIPPERCDYPKRIEGTLVAKYVEISKKICRKGIVDGSVPNSISRKLESYPTFAASPPVQPVIPQAVSMASANHSFALFGPPASKPERPVVPLEPLSNRTQSIFSTKPVEAVQADPLKRSRESVTSTPSTPVEDVSNVFAPQQPPKKRVDVEISVPVAETAAIEPLKPPPPPVPMPELPDPPMSGFDLLAMELGSISIDRAPTERASGWGVPEPPLKSATAKLVQQELDQDIERMRELDISGKRARFFAIKCLEVWRAMNHEEGKWKRLIGDGRAATRL